MNVAAIVKRASEKGGFVRERYAEKDIPTSISNITVMLFFGDMRSMFVLSSLVLNRYREEAKGSKYFILCSWPGYEALFPYVNEYWSVRDMPAVQKMLLGARGFTNTSELTVPLCRNLNHFFDDVVEADAVTPYYNNGITQEYFDKFRHIKRYLPVIPSAAMLRDEFLRDTARRPGYKVFLYPVTTTWAWRNGSLQPIACSKDFWLGLVERLIKENITPVVCKNYYTHDISSEFTDACVYLEDDNIARILAAMRFVGCTLDVFSGVSRLSLAARTPFVACDERARYATQKEYEIDDLCGLNVPRDYIFSFSTIIESDKKPVWNVNLFDSIMRKLTLFLPRQDREGWPSTSESETIIPYEVVRKKRTRRFGTRFIRVERV